MKNLLTIILVAVAIGGLALGLINRPADTPDDPASKSANLPDPAAGAITPGHVVKVTYFTTNVRCPSCLKIEELTRQTVQSRFAGEVEAGTVLFQLINTDLPGNSHYLDDYHLVSKTVVVAEFNQGRQGEWVNLQDVWLKFTKPEEFEAYVADAVKALL